MKLQFFGAARTVTGSCHLLEIGTKRILLDCGLFQGHRKESFERNRHQPFKAESIDSVILSHAHIDHSGNLPRLVAAGFKGRIYSTSATRDLCEWMLRDSGFIQEKDVEYVNRRRMRNGQHPFEPLYTQADAERAIDRFRSVPYGEVREVEPGIRLRFQDAGHMLGSASCHLEWKEDGRGRTLVFTGDLGRGDRPILRDPVPPTKAEILICESTYGDRRHPPGEDVEERLGEVVRTTHERGGKVLIPAFSVGRTQHLVYHLNALFNDVKIPTLPIFVDSPLATNATQVFRDHPECYDEETRRLIERDHDPFGFYRLTYVRDVEASKAINQLRSPCVIISASGMCEAGRVIHHLKHVAPDPANTILVVGYMAPHTLGRRIVERAERIKLFGDEFPLRASVETMSGLSGHADQGELLEFLSRFEKPPERTFLVHGEEDQSLPFAERLRGRGFPRVDVPQPAESFEV